MIKTAVTPLVHSPDEYAIVAMPGNESIQKIVAIQKQLKTLLGDAIWLTPSNTLHSTLMEIICDTQYKELSREEHFKHWYKQYNREAKETIAQFQPIEVNFNEIYASRAAIILKETDPKPFNEIRKTLLKNTTLPAQTKLPPDIIHCTIARYNQSLDLDDIKANIQKITVNLELHVNEFKLMKDLGPDFHPTVVETYKLDC